MGDDLRTILYFPLLTMHGAWRWVVLVTALAATIAGWRAWLGRSKAPAATSRFARFFVLAADVQLALGLSLYVLASPVTRGVFAGGDADPESRWFAFVHAGGMIGVLVLAHAGKVASARAASARAGGRIAALLFTPALAVLLLAMPWWRPLLRL